MTYVGNNYSAADVGPIAIDTIATIGVTIISLATLVGLVLVWNMVKKHF